MSDVRLIQPGACDRCTQGVMDADRRLADGKLAPGNDHLYGRCRCACHGMHIADGRVFTVDLDRVTSDDLRTLLSLVVEREAKQLEERTERIARANELLSKPTIGAFRRHYRQTQERTVDL
jgi:hypothetical protein